MARSETESLMFLDCIGFIKHPLTDCRTYTHTVGSPMQIDMLSEDYLLT